MPLNKEGNKMNCSDHPDYKPIYGEPDSCLRCWQAYARHCHQQRCESERLIARLQERIAKLEATGSGFIN